MNEFMSPDVNSPSRDERFILEGGPDGPAGKTPAWEPPVNEAPEWRKTLKRVLPSPILSVYRAIARPIDPLSVAKFVVGPVGETSFSERFRIAKRIHEIHRAVHCVHLQHEIIAFIAAALSIPRERDGCLVEAGCYKGGGTAKLSLAAKLSGRDLIAFDSFEGIPPNDESHDKDIWGYPISFPGGSWSGSLEEVKQFVGQWGELDACQFMKGWFEDTMPSFSRPVAVAFLDVDLASSTRTCLKHLYPLLIPGGVLLSQDGQIPLVVDVFEDEAFWRDEVGVPMPNIEKFGHKLLKIVKPEQ